MSRRKKLTLWTSPLVLVLLLVGWTAYQVGRVQDRADRLAATGTGAIKLLSELAAGLANSDLDRVLSCYADDYRQPAQGAWEQEVVSERDGVTVSRWRATEPRAFDRAAIGEQMADLFAGVESFELAKLKLARVEEASGPDLAVVRAVLWLRGRKSSPDGGGERFESQAKLRLHLVRREGADAESDPAGGWKIARQELLEGTTTRGSGDGFVDVTAAAGIGHRAQRNPLFSTAEWRPEKFEILKYGSAGVSAGDVDGDGWVDLFFADGIAPRLYRNLGPGAGDFDGASDGGGLRFADVTAAAGLPVELPGVNVALFVDLDNDGDDDLFLGRFMERNLLFRNDGAGADGVPRFTDASDGLAGIHHFVVVANAADYDGDGDLDLYLGRYLDPRVDLPTTLFYTRNGQGNSLLRNDGDLRFTEVTDEAGVREGGLTLGVAWADYDADGDQDLYVANDFGRNALLRNEGPDAAGRVRFADVSEETGSLDFGFGMSASWSDADNDGDLDLYISNVHSGQRWYGQSTTLQQYLLTSIRQGTFGDDWPIYREIYDYAGADWQDYGDGMVKGNSLLLNDGRGAFEESSEIAGANPFGWYWGSAFLDYDNDGWQDVYAANGWVSGRTYDDL